MSQRKRKSYSPEFKIEAIKLITEKGYSISEASRSLGIECRVRDVGKNSTPVILSKPSPAGEGLLALRNQKMKTINENLETKIRKIAVWTGILFLTAMAASLIGGVAFVEPHLSALDPLAAVAENQTQVIFGMILELINGIAVAGIGILIYPVFRRHSRLSAVGYLALRILEAVFCCLIVVSPLSLLAISGLSQDPVAASAAAALSIAQRGVYSGLLLPVFFGLAALVFYYSLIRFNLLPSWISIWGLIGGVLILIMNLLLTFQVDLGSLAMLFALPIISNEIFLGIWLIAKGFETAFPAATSAD